VLINRLLQRQQNTLQLLVAQARQQQQQLHAEQWLLRQRAIAFIGTAPGLMLSFSAGCLFQLRHKSVVKAARKIVGFSWLRSWL
jgi:hypothetical protein